MSNSSNSITEQTDDPQARSIMDMARQLGIDPTTEFHLLSIAQHALESPVHVGENGIEQHSDLDWFKSLVEGERKRHAEAPQATSSNPWLKLTNPKGKAFWYNFQTRRKSNYPPSMRPNADVNTKGDTGLGVMRFTSWWNEHDQKRFIHINYYLDSEEFEVNLDHDPNLYRVKSIRGKYGPVTCWDLHIGAVLNVFGKSVTLRQCDAETRKWIVSNCKRLFALKKGLEAKLIKYEALPRATLVTTGNKPQSEVHLRQLVKAVDFLKRRLAHHRPAVAEKFKI